MYLLGITRSAHKRIRSTQATTRVNLIEMMYLLLLVMLHWSDVWLVMLITVVRRCGWHYYYKYFKKISRLYFLFMIKALTGVVLVISLLLSSQPEASEPITNDIDSYSLQAIVKLATAVGSMYPMFYDHAMNFASNGDMYSQFFGQLLECWEEESVGVGEIVNIFQVALISINDGIDLMFSYGY